MSNVSQEVANAIQQQFGGRYLPNLNAVTPSVGTAYTEGYTISPIPLPPIVRPMYAEPDREVVE